MKLTPILLLAAAAALAQEGPGGGMSFIRMSPILNAVDVNQDGVISAQEIANAPAQIRKLVKSADGSLTRAEAGMQMGGRGRGPGGRGEGEGGRGGGDEAPAAAPSADELTATLMMFDANHDGKLEKSEVPERMQGLFERGDTNHDGILTRDEIAKLAEANRNQAGRGPGAEGFSPGDDPARRGFPGGPGGRGGPGGPGGPNQFDVAFNALDANHDGVISAAEINNASESLKALDKNGDGRITEDEVMPNLGGRGGFGRGPGGEDR